MHSSAKVAAQPAKRISICHWLILGVLSVMGSACAMATPASAETKRLNYTLSTQGNQNFAALMHQAEDLAGNLVQQAFAQSPDITEVSIKIVGERNGQEAPLLFSSISRSDWQQQPRIQPWTRYFSNSAVLLGFLKLQIPADVATTPEFDGVAASLSDREPNFYQ